MKQLYIITLLFFTTIASSQNDLLGQWYLKYIVVGNITHYNNYNDESFYEMEITEDAVDQNLFIIEGTSVCNSFGGSFSISENELVFNDLGFTLQDCAFSPGEVFESIYHYDVLNNAPYINPDGYSFSITGTNENESLTLTDPSTGNHAVYGRVPSPNILTRTWYLSRIEIPGNPTIEIPVTESPSLTITNVINPISFRTTAYGEGECNSFISDYEISLNNGDNIQLLDFTPTLGFCESDFEDAYFGIIGYAVNNFSEFEIINNGTTLNVTDLLGARLVFGDEPLSVSETDLNTLQISLKTNPVNSQINLTISQQPVNELKYQIYSIDGKRIKETLLRSESINVEDLHSGIYFIRFTNRNQQQTIKFIKQ